MTLVLQNNADAIYQFTIILIFLVALVFFVYMYWYSQRLSQSVAQEQEVKRKLLLNNMELEKAQFKNSALEAEQKAKQEKNLRLEQAMTLKNKELTTTTLLVSQHNQVLNEISRKIDGLGREKDPKATLKNIKRLIRNNLSLENDWDHFKSHFEQVHPDFFENLSEKHSNLSMNDVRHCAYMRMRMSTKEIARMFNINPTSVQIARVRMKKKMSLDKEIDLRQYILSF